VFPVDEENSLVDEFFEWCRKNIDQGNLVVHGFKDINGEDTEYDHIMPIVGYKKDESGNLLGIYYNDLYDTSESKYLSVDENSNQEPSDDDEADTKYAIPEGSIFAIALKGNVDPDSETVRMKLTIPTVDEPDWGVEDKINADPVPFTLSATLAGLTSGL
jgi:hypothetical protein